MRSREFVRRLTLAALLAVGVAATAKAAPLQDTKSPYAADVTVTTDGKDATKGRVFAAPGMQRFEGAARKGADTVLITRFDRGASYILDPGRRIYLELPIRPDTLAGWDDRNLRLTPAGSESVAGAPATKYRIEGDLRPGVHAEGFIWRTSDNILLKTDVAVSLAGGTRSESVYELSNLRRGQQKPTLFEVPAGYKKEELPAR